MPCRCSSQDSFYCKPANKCHGFDRKFTYSFLTGRQCKCSCGSHIVTSNPSATDGKAPHPCNGSLVIEKAYQVHQGIYTCHARNLIALRTINITVRVIFLGSCSDIRQAGFSVSKIYYISPGGLAPFAVYCDMRGKDGVGVTIISHDSEERRLVSGAEKPGTFQRKINYNGYSKQQLVSLIDASTNCEQFLKYECYGSVLLDGDYGWWVSRDGVKMNYWGGAPPGSQKCACGVNKSCSSSRLSCNCDTNENVCGEDSGILTDRSTLPVPELRFGDT